MYPQPQLQQQENKNHRTNCAEFAAEGKTPADEALEVCTHAHIQAESVVLHHNDTFNANAHIPQVVFEDQGIRRRKSSLIPDQTPDWHNHTHKMSNSHGGDRPNGGGRKLTSCYVHGMLENHREGTYTPREGSDKTSDKDPHGKIANGVDTQHTESRLLTKKQLSDMAFGIRELSKKLSHIKLKLNVRNIFILTKVHDESVIGNTRELTGWLLKQEDKKYTVWVEDKLEKHAKFDAKGLLAEEDGKFAGRLKYWDNELCRRRPSTFDIVLGVCLHLYHTPRH